MGVQALSMQGVCVQSLIHRGELISCHWCVDIHCSWMLKRAAPVCTAASILFGSPLFSDGAQWIVGYEFGEEPALH